MCVYNEGAAGRRRRSIFFFFFLLCIVCSLDDDDVLEKYEKKSKTTFYSFHCHGSTHTLFLVLTCSPPISIIHIYIKLGDRVNKRERRNYLLYTRWYRFSLEKSILSRIFLTPRAHTSIFCFVSYRLIKFVGVAYYFLVGNLKKKKNLIKWQMMMMSSSGGSNERLKRNVCVCYTHARLNILHHRSSPPPPQSLILFSYIDDEKKEGRERFYWSVIFLSNFSSQMNFFFFSCSSISHFSFFIKKWQK